MEVFSLRREDADSALLEHGMVVDPLVIEFENARRVRASDARDALESSWMVVQIWRDVVNDAAQHTPRVVWCGMPSHFVHGNRRGAPVRRQRVASTG